MDYKVVMPRLSDSMDEGQLVAWKIRPGDIVKNGDVIAEVESDKAVMEIQTFRSGKVKEILIEEGSIVPVGTAMAVIDTEAKAGDAGSKERSGGERSDAVEHEKKKEMHRSREEKKPGTEQSVGEKRERTEDLSARSDRTPLEILMTLSESTAPRLHSYTGGNASPRARSLAARYGLDIETLQKEKRLPVPAHVADIKRYRLQRYFTPEALALLARYRISDDLFDRGRKHDKEEIMEYIRAHGIPLPRPLDMAHRAMIAMVEESAKKPVYHMSGHIDATLLKQNETKERTVTVWLLRLFSEALMRHEQFRTTLVADGIRLWPNASVSVAMAEGEHLYMPVFRDINRKTLHQIAEELSGFKTKIKEKRLNKDDLTGSTFGISNLGMAGVEQFDAMINKEDSAIAAIGAETEGRIAVTLTIDHRIVNGYQAAQFMQTLKALAEDPLLFKER